MTVPPIRIAAALILDAAGRALLVRKRGIEAFMQAGGKIEPAAELEDVRWVDPAAPDLPLAPLTRDHVLPLAQRFVK